MSQENGKKPKAMKAKLFDKVKPDKMKDDAAKKEMPNLLDVLLPIWEGSTMLRQPGRLSISPDGGSWRVTVECPTEGLQTVLMTDSLPTLLIDVEKLLASGSARWGMSWQRRKKNLPTIDDLIQ